MNPSPGTYFTVFDVLISLVVLGKTTLPKKNGSLLLSVLRTESMKAEHAERGTGEVKVHHVFTLSR